MSNIHLVWVGYWVTFTSILWQPTSVTNVACRERDWPPCRIHAYTVYTPIGGKGRCHTRHDLQDHSMQARKSAGKISTLDLKPMWKDTQSPKQEQSVAPQNGPWSRQKILKKRKKTYRAVSKYECKRKSMSNIRLVWVGYWVTFTSLLWLFLTCVGYWIWDFYRFSMVVFDICRLLLNEGFLPFYCGYFRHYRVGSLIAFHLHIFYSKQQKDVGLFVFAFLMVPSKSYWRSSFWKLINKGHLSVRIWEESTLHGWDKLDFVFITSCTNRQNWRIRLNIFGICDSLIDVNQGRLLSASESLHVSPDQPWCMWWFCPSGRYCFTRTVEYYCDWFR